MKAQWWRDSGVNKLFPVEASVVCVVLLLLENGDRDCGPTPNILGWIFSHSRISVQTVILTVNSLSGHLDPSPVSVVSVSQQHILWYPDANVCVLEGQTEGICNSCCLSQSFLRQTHEQELTCSGFQNQSHKTTYIMTGQTQRLRDKNDIEPKQNRNRKKLYTAMLL